MGSKLNKLTECTKQSTTKLEKSPIQWSSSSYYWIKNQNTKPTKNSGPIIIETEPKRTHTITQQCFNCQRYGQSQTHCKMYPRCHRCAGEHHYKECTKNKETPPKCCYCGGAHSANFRGCTKNPSNGTKSNPQPTNNTNTYADAVTSQPQQNNTDMLTIIAEQHSIGHTNQNFSTSSRRMLTASITSKRNYKPT